MCMQICKWDMQNRSIKNYYNCMFPNGRKLIWLCPLWLKLDKQRGACFMYLGSCRGVLSQWMIWVLWLLSVLSHSPVIILFLLRLILFLIMQSFWHQISQTGNACSFQGYLGHMQCSFPPDWKILQFELISLVLGLNKQLQTSIKMVTYYHWPCVDYSNTVNPIANQLNICVRN